MVERFLNIAPCLACALVALASCGDGQEAGSDGNLTPPSAKASQFLSRPEQACRSIEKRDLGNLTVTLTHADITEGSSDMSRGSVSLFFKSAQECISARWRTLPVGDNPADASDFVGGRFPQGVISIPSSSDLSRSKPAFSFSVVNDGKIERNENFKVEILDMQGGPIWGYAVPKPTVSSSIEWQRSAIDPPYAVFTIHDDGSRCPAVGKSSDYRITASSDDVPSIEIERPLPVIQCATLPWEIVGGSALSSLTNGQVRKGVVSFPSFSQLDDDETVKSIPLSVKRGRSLNGKSIRIRLGTEERSIVIE